MPVFSNVNFPVCSRKNPQGNWTHIGKRWFPVVVAVLISCRHQERRVMFMIKQSRPLWMLPKKRDCHSPLEADEFVVSVLKACSLYSLARRNRDGETWIATDLWISLRPFPNVERELSFIIERRASQKSKNPFITPSISHI